MFFEQQDLQSTIKQKSYILASLYVEMVEFFYKWCKTMQVQEGNEYIVSNAKKTAYHVTPLRNELLRVLTSNNISKYFDYKIMRGALKRNLYEAGYSYVYSSIGNDRPKYQPLIWSLPRDDGKPLSLEARIFPNSYFLMNSPEEIKLVIDEMIERLNVLHNLDATKTTTLELFSLKQIQQAHAFLCSCLSFAIGNIK